MAIDCTDHCGASRDDVAGVGGINVKNPRLAPGFSSLQGSE
jgi:hypothetical protein